MKIWGVTKGEKKIIIHANHTDGSKILYDGKDKWLVPYKDWKKNRDDYYHSDFKYIKAERVVGTGKERRKLTMEEVYEEFIRDANLLKELSNGLINMYKSGDTVSTALSLFDHFNSKRKEPIIPDPISLEEAEWLIDTKSGPLIWCKEYQGPIWKYDFASHYPSTMQHPHVLFPVKAGEFLTWKEFEYNPAIAIYRCEIEPTNDSWKLFRINNKNKYTSVDLRRARELKLNIKLIQDGEPNVLLYNRQKCVTGSQLFGEYVKYLFPLRKKCGNRAKELLNCLWGALSREGKIVKVFHETEEIDEFEGRQIYDFKPYGNDEIIVTFIKNNSLFAFNYARIAPFILAHGRARLSKEMGPHINSIVRCHTDSMFSTIDLNNVLNIGDDIGQLKYEGHSPEIQIINSIDIKIIKEFSK